MTSCLLGLVYDLRDEDVTIVVEITPGCRPWRSLPKTARAAIAQSAGNPDAVDVHIVWKTHRGATRFVAERPHGNAMRDLPRALSGSRIVRWTASTETFNPARGMILVTVPKSPTGTRAGACTEGNRAQISAASTHSDTVHRRLHGRPRPNRTPPSPSATDASDFAPKASVCSPWRWYGDVSAVLQTDPGLTGR